MILTSYQLKETLVRMLNSTCLRLPPLASSLVVVVVAVAVGRSSFHALSFPLPSALRLALKQSGRTLMS